jgi:hypothetical protein
MSPCSNGSDEKAVRGKRAVRKAIAVLTIAVGCYRMNLHTKKMEKERKHMILYERGVTTAALRDLFYSCFNSLDSAFFLAIFHCTRYQYEQIRNCLRPHLEIRVTPNNVIAHQNLNR